MADQMIVQATPVRIRGVDETKADLRLSGILFFLLATAFLSVTMLAASIAPAI